VDALEIACRQFGITTAYHSHRPPVTGQDTLYSAGGDTAGEPVTATALPYFQWDNRDGRAMRVWLPLHTAPPAAPPPAGSPDAPEAG